MANLTKSKLVQLDRMLSILVGMANRAAVALSPLFARFRKGAQASPREAATITIAKFEGIGSILYAMGLARAIRKAHPSVKLKFFTREENVKFVERFDEIDEIVLLKGESILQLAFSWIQAVFKARSDIYIDLEVYSHFSALTSLATFSWWRAGFFRESANFRTGLYTHSVFFNSYRHVTSNYLQLGRCLGFEISPTELPQPRLHDHEGEIVRTNYRKKHPGCLLVAVNPNASDLLYERRWPLEKFAAVLNAASGEFSNAVFVITGSPAEKEYAEQLLRLCGNMANVQVFNAAGALSFGEFLALIREADLLFTNDSGPLHLAFAYGTPSLSLWGPGDTKHYGPLHQEIHAVVETNLFCSPCIYQTSPPPCRGDNICMKNMPESEVLGLLLAKLRALESFSNSAVRAAYVISPWKMEKYNDNRPSGVATNETIKTPLK
jgi:ADP-heptose:LPS heptosyltransferase